MTPRVLFYVQHLLGIGHLRRAAAIGRALAGGGFDVAFVSGGEAVPSLDIGAARLVQLPAVRSGDFGFSSLVDDSGAAVTMHWWRARQAALEFELASRAGCRADRDVSVRPAAVPLGIDSAARTPPAGAGRGPWWPARCATSWWTRTSPTGCRRCWMFWSGTMTWCWSMAIPTFADFALTFPAAADIADKIRYTGFVVAICRRVCRLPHGRMWCWSRPAAARSARRCCNAALAARPLTQQRDALWHFITGPKLAQTDFAALAKAAGDKLRIERFRPDFPLLLRVLPRIGLAGRLQHADGNSRRGHAGRGGAVCRRAGERADPAGPAAGGTRPGAGRGAGGFDAGTLAAAIDAAAAMPVPPSGIFNLKGAAATAEILHQALRQRRAA